MRSETVEEKRFLWLFVWNSTSKTIHVRLLGVSSHSFVHLPFLDLGIYLRIYNCPKAMAEALPFSVTVHVFSLARSSSLSDCPSTFGGGSCMSSFLELPSQYLFEREKEMEGQKRHLRRKGAHINI